MSNLSLNRGPCPRKTSELLVQVGRPLLEGIITWELGRFSGGIDYVRRKATFRNLITNGGLDVVGTTNINTARSFVAVGTGSTAPANTDTSLVAEVQRVSRTTTGDLAATSGASFVYSGIKRVFLLLEGEGNGNLTEVGFYNQASGGTLFARQLFKDGTGTPTTVTKTINDELRITYEVRMYPPTADVVQTVTISTVDYTITSRAMLISAWTPESLVAGATTNAALAFEANVLGTTNGNPGGIGQAPSSTTVAAYVNGNHYRETTCKWEPAVANYATGIGSLEFLDVALSVGERKMFQCSFAPKIPKDVNKRFTLTSRLSWDRFTP